MLQPLSRSRLVITVVRLALAALIAVPAVASAQTITGQISGRVTDASGGVLPGVTVTVVNEGTGFKDVRVTDSGGVFTFTNLRVGTYSVMVELEGFRKEQRTGFSLTADGRISADFALGVGQLSEQVEVTAVLGETVNRTSGEVARTIDSQQIKDLAFNGRNYMELASLIPGAVATDYDPIAEQYKRARPQPWRTHIERYTIIGDREESEKLDLGEGSTAHAVARGFGPGILGLRWGW